MTVAFAITFDYLCPFARIANEAVVEGLRAGHDWDVTFRPFSLAQTKVADDETAVWDRDAGSEGTRGVLALQWGIAVRDGWPDRISDFHPAVFDARHGRGADIGDETELANVAESVGLDPALVAAEVAAGRPMLALRSEHEDLVAKWAVFGVPTFITGDEAVFVRLMDRHRPDEIDRIVGLLGWSSLNEFKRTSIPR
jgi:protein-disulfide isomerase-like protein with CxxC motif